jgi:hypothetical protein
MFKDGRMDFHGEERSVRPFLVSADFLKVLNKNCVKDGASQFQNLPQISCSVLYEIITG